MPSWVLLLSYIIIMASMRKQNLIGRQQVPAPSLLTKQERDKEHTK